MFSVGICAECGKYRCGEHGALYLSRFLCVEHITEFRKEAKEKKLEEESRLHQEQLEAAKRAVQAERDAIERVAPGFPVDSATGPELAAVLARLVPGYTQRIEAGTKSFGRTAYVTGWGFELGWAEYDGKFSDKTHHGLVVTTQGQLYQNTFPVPGAWLTARTGKIDQADRHALRYVLRTVLTWLGVTLPCVASEEQHFLVAYGQPLRVPHPTDWGRWLIYNLEWPDLPH